MRNQNTCPNSFLQSLEFLAVNFCQPCISSEQLFFQHIIIIQSSIRKKPIPSNANLLASPFSETSFEAGVSRVLLCLVPSLSKPQAYVIPLPTFQVFRRPIMFSLSLVNHLSNLKVLNFDFHASFHLQINRYPGLPCHVRKT